jgi:hypothetical protein
MCTLREIRAHPRKSASREEIEIRAHPRKSASREEMEIRVHPRKSASREENGNPRPSAKIRVPRNEIGANPR